MAEPVEFMDCEEENEGEEVFDIEDCDDEYKKFDSTIGHIEDIIMGDEFQGLQNNFMERYHHEFEDVDENKFVYSDIHREYTTIIETYLTQKLTQLIPDFSMGEFLNEVKETDLDYCEVFEILSSFSDFSLFKEAMLQYKKSKENDYSDICLGAVTVRPIIKFPAKSVTTTVSKQQLQQRVQNLKNFNHQTKEPFGNVVRSNPAANRDRVITKEMANSTGTDVIVKTRDGQGDGNYFKNSTRNEDDSDCFMKIEKLDLGM
ncbi:hypothetical protein HELRODRAFT_170727 [Helobdella robusta]|uniref:ADP-ribosylation factor-like protein 2-binding protein n=1 Tax=Helobdella robusta TaxID=6412 RepID=T1F3D1_HELRO|nr:hypothetical protein HELRODRAFT_170727 [Helobdella robusta]ESO07392.1 hypothetical protein HELRODRAFT_170727 [Helobdella robusta]